MIIESLAEGGVKMGLPRELATELSAQTLLGAASLVLHTGEHSGQVEKTGPHHARPPATMMD